MKFTPKESFRHGYTTFETGNTYDSEAQGLTEAELRAFHHAGWAEVEGMDPAPARQTQNVTINPKKAGHAHKAQEVHRG